MNVKENFTITTENLNFDGFDGFEGFLLNYDLAAYHAFIIAD